MYIPSLLQAINLGDNSALRSMLLDNPELANQEICLDEYVKAPPVAFAAYVHNVEALKILSEFRAIFAYHLDKPQLLSIWHWVSLDSKMDDGVIDFLEAKMEMTFNKQMNVFPEEGYLKNLAVFMVLGETGKVDKLAEVIYQASKEELQAMCEVKTAVGRNLVWMLAHHAQWGLAEYVLKKCDRFDVSYIPDVETGERKNAFYLACLAQQWKVVRLMLTKAVKVEINFSVDDPDLIGLTPLVLACVASQWEVVRLMIRENKPDVNTISPHLFLEGRSPLWMAACENQWDIVLDMAKTGEANGHICPSDFLNTMQMASKNNQMEILGLLDKTVIPPSLLIADDSSEESQRPAVNTRKRICILRKRMWGDSNPYLSNLPHAKVTSKTSFNDDEEMAVNLLLGLRADSVV